MPDFGVARAAGLHDANMGRSPVMEVEGLTIGNTAPMERFLAKRLGMQGKNDLEVCTLNPLPSNTLI